MYDDGPPAEPVPRSDKLRTLNTENKQAGMQSGKQLEFRVRPKLNCVPVFHHPRDFHAHHIRTKNSALRSLASA
jgi:hypothetical protein